MADVPSPGIRWSVCIRKPGDCFTASGMLLTLPSRLFAGVPYSILPAGLLS
jgi:hypothetical protein